MSGDELEVGEERERMGKEFPFVTTSWFFGIRQLIVVGDKVQFLCFIAVILWLQPKDQRHLNQLRKRRRTGRDMYIYNYIYIYPSTLCIFVRL